MSVMRTKRGWMRRYGPLVLCSTQDGHAWFRLFGKGLWWRDLRRIDEQHVLLSERYPEHFRKRFHEVGWLRWGVLR